MHEQVSNQLGLMKLIQFGIIKSEIYTVLITQGKKPLCKALEAKLQAKRLSHEGLNGLPGS